MTTVDTTPIRDSVEQLLTVRDVLVPRKDGGAPLSVLDLLAAPGVWESFADAASAGSSGDDRYATVLLGLAIDADRYLGDVPAELRSVAAAGFSLLGIVERIRSEISHDETVSYASVCELEQLPLAIGETIDEFKQAAADAYRDATWNKGPFTRVTPDGSRT